MLESLCRASGFCRVKPHRDSRERLSRSACLWFRRRVATKVIGGNGELLKEEAALSAASSVCSDIARLHADRLRDLDVDRGEPVVPVRFCAIDDTEELVVQRF